MAARIMIALTAVLLSTGACAPRATADEFTLSLGYGARPVYSTAYYAATYTGPAGIFYEDCGPPILFPEYYPPYVTTYTRSEYFGYPAVRRGYTVRYRNVHRSVHVTRRTVYRRVPSYGVHVRVRAGDHHSRRHHHHSHHGRTHIRVRRH